MLEPSSLPLTFLLRILSLSYGAGTVGSTVYNSLCKSLLEGQRGWGFGLVCSRHCFDSTVAKTGRWSEAVVRGMDGLLSLRSGEARM